MIKRFLHSDFFYEFQRNPVAVLSLLVIALIILAAIFADFIAPHNPFEPASLNLLNGFTPPLQANDFTGETFLMGTDDQGRDLFSTILFGLRISLFVGMMSVILAMILGVTLGLIAGFVGGWIDAFIMRFADIQMTFPSILVAMLIYGVAKGLLPPDLRYEMSIAVLIISIGLSEWVPFARTVRGSTLVEKEKEYITAAKMLNLSNRQLMIRHLLPNVLIAEATLSFLGVGVPTTKPSLGTLIRIGQDFLFSGEWWILFFPAITLLMLALSINLFGDWLRDMLNPKRK
jgi:peptide/nickel transport system permease protein